MSRRLIILLLALLLSAAPAANAIELTDDSGRTVTFDKPFTRIISLYGAHTENLLCLGLDKEILGVCPRDSHLAAIKGKPVFHYRDDPERFMAAGPDLVLVRPMIRRVFPNLMAALEKAGITVASLQPTSVDQMLSYWRKLGSLTGKARQSEKMVGDFKSRLAVLRGRTAHIDTKGRPKVFFESIHRRMKTFSPQSMAIFVLESAGGVNLAADARPASNSNIADYGKERIMSLGPEMDVYLVQVGAMNKVGKQDIINEGGFKAIKAVRQGRVYCVDERVISRPTPRILEGIEAVQNLLYPNLKGH